MFPGLSLARHKEHAQEPEVTGDIEGLDSSPPDHDL